MGNNFTKQFKSLKLKILLGWEKSFFEGNGFFRFNEKIEHGRLADEKVKTALLNNSFSVKKRRLKKMTELLLISVVILLVLFWAIKVWQRDNNNRKKYNALKRKKEDEIKELMDNEAGFITKIRELQSELRGRETINTQLKEAMQEITSVEDIKLSYALLAQLNLVSLLDDSNVVYALKALADDAKEDELPPLVKEQMVSIVEQAYYATLDVSMLGDDVQPKDDTDEESIVFLEKKREIK